MVDLTDIAGAALKGAAAGSIVPGVGTAIGAVGSVALTLAPEIGKWLFGPDAAQVVQQVQQVATAVTGTPDPAAQVAALEDPAVATQLRVQLAAIAAQREAQAAAASQARLIAQLADVHDARATTLALAQTGSPMAWGAAVVSVVVLTTFGAAMALTLLRAIPENAEPVLNVLLGSLTAMATSVVSYWVGSSVGSARKDTRIAALTAGR